MSDFKKFCIDEKLSPVQIVGARKAWQEQQAIIDDLIYKAKLRESDHQALLVKYQATKKCWEDMGKECESLKAKLNNMKACYIEKKKERDELHAVLKCVSEHFEMNDLDSCMPRLFEMIQEALRGAND